MNPQKRCLLLSLIFLATACSEKTARPVPSFEPASAPSPTGQSSHLPQASVFGRPEPAPSAETPASKPVIAAVEPKTESKPHPVVLSAAVQSLLTDAQKQTQTGDLESASVSLERALRISPRNPELTYQLAVLRFKQSQPRLAEDLGKKAEFLAADDAELKKRCWLLIAQAREAQGDMPGANEARVKADNLE